MGKGTGLKRAVNAEVVLAEQVKTITQQKQLLLLKSYEILEKIINLLISVNKNLIQLYMTHVNDLASPAQKNDPLAIFRINQITILDGRIFSNLKHIDSLVSGHQYLIDNFTNLYPVVNLGTLKLQCEILISQTEYYKKLELIFTTELEKTELSIQQKTTSSMPPPLLYGFASEQQTTSSMPPPSYGPVNQQQNTSSVSSPNFSSTFPGFTATNSAISPLGSLYLSNFKLPMASLSFQTIIDSKFKLR